MSEYIDMLDLLSTARPHADTLAWRDGTPLLYAGFVARVEAWCRLLQRTPGRDFALYFNDSLEFAAALFGAWQSGKTIYLPSDALPATCAGLQQVVDGYLGEFAAEWMPVSPQPEDNDGERCDFRRLTPDFIGLVVYTSGSTGQAQAVPKKLSQLAAEVATLESLFGAALGAADIVATVSHQHIYGLLFKVLWPLAAGRAIQVRSFTFPEELAQATAARDCVLISSPAHLKRLPDSPVWATAMHRLRAVFSSGGPLPLDVVHTTAGMLQQVPIEVYGSSETGGIAWRQRTPDADETWTAMPGVKWRIAPDDGVLEVSSAHLPDDNWMRLADRAQAAGAGRFLLKGRVDRIVKIEEKRISLDAIEAQLMTSPLVREVRVIVIEGKRQQVAAFIVLSDSGRRVLAESGKLMLNRMLREILAQSVERIALPRTWRYLDALPVNTQGKTTHAQLAALLDVAEPSARPTMPRRRLLESDAQRALFELSAPANLLYFEGHFPDAPILPGVVQVEWAIAIGRECFNLPPAFRAIHALKFQQVIRTEMNFMLELLHDPVKASLTFRYSSQETQHASGKIMFGAAADV